MGIIYDITCPKCGGRFEHLAALGMGYMCVGCGEDGASSSLIFCPHCALKIDPSDPQFTSIASASSEWE